MRRPVASNDQLCVVTRNAGLRRGAAAGTSPIVENGQEPLLEIRTSGNFEARDVIGSLRYARTRRGLSGMAVGLFSRCLGCNSTTFAMLRYPQEFAGVRCLIPNLPLDEFTTA